MVGLGFILWAEKRNEGRRGGDGHWCLCGGIQIHAEMNGGVAKTVSFFKAAWDGIRVQERERVWDVRAKNEQSAADAPIADGQEGKAARGATKRWETGMFVSCGRLEEHLSPFSVVTVIASARCAATVASLQSGVPCHHFLQQYARKRLPIVTWKVSPMCEMKWGQS
jgi:hypothetical protein